MIISLTANAWMTNFSPEDVNRGKLETLISSASETGDLVLQIRNIRNVAAPKAHEESGGAPRMLKVGAKLDVFRV